MRYVLTEAAKDDILEITRYIRVVQKSPQNAMLVARRLRAMFRKLAAAPGIGHMRDELRDEAARVIAVSGVLVVYDPMLKPLTILRVIHASRDLRRIDPRPE